jgi:hypothetical protein
MGDVNRAEMIDVFTMDGFCLCFFLVGNASRDVVLVEMLLSLCNISEITIYISEIMDSKDIHALTRRNHFGAFQMALVAPGCLILAGLRDWYGNLPLLIALEYGFRKSVYKHVGLLIHINPQGAKTWNSVGDLPIQEAA